MQTRRMPKEIHQPLWQQQKPDRDGYLSISPLPAVWWVVGAGFHDRGRVNLAVWSTTQTGGLSTLLSGFLLPHRETLFFSPLIYISTSSSNLSAFPSSHPSLLNLTSSSIQKGKAIKLLSCLLLLPYSFSLHVVTFLLGPVLMICILYFPVLHHSQWGCGLLNVTRINKIKIRLSMRQWPPTHQALSQTSNKNLGETQVMCGSHRHQLVSLYAKPLFLRYVSTCPALNV